MRNVAILLFNDVEVLDFAGPFEVFNVANIVAGKKEFEVFTVAENNVPLFARNKLQIIPDYKINNCPAPDIIIVPGGDGRKIVMNNAMILQWLQNKFTTLELLLSVCTGSFILGNAGLLQGLKATTHHLAYNEFEKKYSATTLVKNVKWVENQKIITAGGISAGINMSLHVVDKLLGNDAGKRTAAYMEYDF